jgi:hypothetical protein
MARARRAATPSPARPRTTTSQSPTAGPAEDYLSSARRPLQILSFLLPLILLYEAALAWLLRSDSGVLTNKAHESLLRFFAALGVPALGGLYVGGLLVVVVLLTWHVLSRQPWRIDRGGLGLMLLESVILTLPLVALGVLVQRSVPLSGGAEHELASLPVTARMAISIGAGIYEELIFRMLLIAVVHTLLVDVLRMRHGWGAAVAAVISAAAFTWYHPLTDEQGVLALRRIVFYASAGLYFAAVYLTRGFGIVVAVHALYDVVTVAFVAPPPGG